MVRTRSRTRRSGWLQIVAPAVALALAPAVLAACTTPRISSVGVAAIPAPSADPKSVGVDLFPIHVPAFIFGEPTPKPVVQPGSTKLVQEAGSHDRLQILALPSGPGTAVVDFLETSRVDEHWGEVMLPTEREVFRLFARQPALGDHLVMLTDVAVVGGSDPIPITAYRWSRADVEAYAKCGIPDVEFTPCTNEFFLRGNSRIISTINLYRGV